MKTPKTKRNRTAPSRSVQRLVRPPLHQYFGLPEHKVSVSAEDFIDGKLPAIVKKANAAGHMVTLSVRPNDQAQPH